MIDLTGRTVREFAQGTTVLSVGDMPRGTYMLTVNDGRNLGRRRSWCSKAPIETIEKAPFEGPFFVSRML